jgi:hypothetical protein
MRVLGGFALAAASVAALIIFTGAAPAQSRGDGEAQTLSVQIKKLQKGLKQRDALIRELMLRVNKLERLVGETKAHAELVQESQPLRRKRGPAGAKSKVDGEHERRRQEAQYYPVTPPPPQAAEAPNPAPSVPASPPPAAPGQFTVSKEAAEHALERALVQTGALLLPPGKVEFVPGLTYQYNQLSHPGTLALTSTGSVLVTEAVSRNSILQPSALFRFGLPWRAEALVNLPFEYESASVTTRVQGAGLTEASRNVSGLADPSFTLIKQVTQEGEWLPSLFLNGVYSQGVGELKHGLQLGNGFDEFRVGFTAAKHQDPLVFTAGFTYQTALENRNIDLGDQYTPSLGMLFAVSPQTSLQFSQQVTFGNQSKFNGRVIPGSQLMEGVFNAGLLSILAPGVVVNFNVAIGETPDAPDVAFMLTFPILLN